MFKIINKFSKKYPTYTAYYTTVQCTICNTERTTRSENIKNIVCEKCKHEKHIKSIIGNKIGIYKILEYSHSIDNKLFYKVECSNCNKEAIKRKDCLSHSKKCSNCKTNNIIHSIKTPRNVLFYHYKQGAIQRNLKFELTNEEFDNLINSNCFYCDSVPSKYKSDLRYNKTSITFLRNGIDRLDPSLGYISSNVVSCCAMCNRMKMAFKEKEWLLQIEKIYKNIIKRSTTIPNGSTPK